MTNKDAAVQAPTLADRFRAEARAKDLSMRVDTSTPERTSILASMPDTLQRYVAETIGHIDQAGVDDDALWSIGERGLQMEMAGRLIAGRAFMDLSTRVDKLTLASELRNRAIPRSTFYSVIEVYRTVEPLPRLDAVRSFVALGHTKMRDTASWSEDERLALAQGEEVRGLTIDQAVAMPTREFQKLAKADDELARERQRRIDAEAALKALEKHHQKPAAIIPSIAPELAATRDQMMFLLERMQAEVSLISQLSADKLIVEDARARPDFHDRLAVAKPVYHFLNGVIATAVQFLGELDAGLGHSVAGSLTAEYQYLDREREHLAELLAAARSTAHEDFGKAVVDSRKKNKTRGRHS